MRVPRLLSMLVAFCLLVLLVPSVRADNTRPFPALKKDFRKALKSKDPQVRADAFEILKDCRDGQVVAEIMYGVEKAHDEIERIKAAQANHQKELAGLINKLKKAQDDFDRSTKSTGAMDKYNKSERKISKASDAARTALQDTENDWTRVRSMIQRGCGVMGGVLAKVPDDVLVTALIDLDTLWLHGKNKRGPQYWLDSVREVKRTQVSDALHYVVDDAEAPLPIRVSVIGALAERDDGLMLGKALKMLKLPMDRAPLITASIYALRQMHDKRAIKPLIEVLNREDLKRLREDVHVTLLSLTGQKQIGPYYEPWNTWFRENGLTFQMPKHPMPPGQPVEEREGMTFYGIHTFSDRVLFIVDASASMDWALKGVRGSAGGSNSKMATARKELIGAVFNLNAGEQFNVILFNHEIIPWRKGEVTVSTTTQNQLKRWITEMKPTGLTNIHDALERGFRVATATTGEVALDTVYFLTDGKPTAGKIQDPKKILEAVREWNEGANLRIHVIGIGDDLDVEFLQELAKIGDGKFVKR